MSSPLKRRRRTVNKAGRNKYAGFILLAHYVYESAAYQSLKPIPRAVYMELRRRFYGFNNGQIAYSVRDMATRVHCSKDSAGEAFHELEDKGLIKCTRPGWFNYKLRHAAEWELTEEPCNGNPATEEFRYWRPLSKEKGGPAIGTAGPESRTSNAKTATNKRATVPEEGQSATIEQCSRSLKADTYNIPGASDKE